MGANKDAYMHDVEAANDAASVVSEDIAATNGFSSSLPPFQQAIVLKDELPEMPAEVIEGVLLETHKMLLTGPSKAGKTVFVKTVVSWVARKTFRPGTASFHVRQGMPLSAFS